jgi:hypothetical protein
MSEIKPALTPDTVYRVWYRENDGPWLPSDTIFTTDSRGGGPDIIINGLTNEATYQFRYEPTSEIGRSR